MDHPATIYHKFRYFVFATYEKRGFDDALDLVANSKYPPNFKAGLKGELLFYDEYRKKYSLEPLLDAGVKADFTGKKDGILTNFDVTTNVDYKNIDDYIEVVQERGKVYEIALVDRKNEEIIFYPLKFPICSKCGKFSHNILFLEPPLTDNAHSWGMSDEQAIIQFCQKCKTFKEIQSLNYLINSMNKQLEHLSSETDELGNRIYSRRELRAIEKKDSIKTVNLYERDADVLISGLAENYYVVTDPSDYDGYHDGLLHWKHPLAQELPQLLGIHYGKWEPSYSDLKEFFKNEECRLCKHKPMRLNAKKKTLTCYRCGLIHDFSENLYSQGWELKKTRKRRSRFKNFKPRVKWR